MVVEGDDTDQQEDPEMLQAQPDPFFSGPANETRVHHLRVSLSVFKTPSSDKSSFFVTSS